MSDPAAAHSTTPSAAGGARPGAEGRRLREAVMRLFGEDAAVAAEVEAVASLVDVPGGTVLFREGDPGDSAYVVLAGRLRAVADGEDGDQVLSDAVRGETIGELGLITNQPRSATVYAVRDSTVARIGGADFETLLRERPEVALPIMRILAGRLRRLTRGPGDRVPLERTVAVLPIGAADAEAFAMSLAHAIEAGCSVSVLTARSGGTHQTIDALLEDHGPEGHVLVCAGEGGWTAWNALVVRHAD